MGADSPPAGDSMSHKLVLLSTSDEGQPIGAPLYLLELRAEAINAC